MKQYTDLVETILREGSTRSDRTGTGTIGIFGHQMKFDLYRHGFPLLGLKKTFFKGIVAELLWFLRGDTNIKWLKEQGVHIWDEWADSRGYLGPIYGAMWRNWPVISENIDCDSDREWNINSTDQIANLIKGLRENPFSRRHIVSGWNPGVLPRENLSPQDNVGLGLQALPPCHTLFQMHVQESPSGTRFLSCQLYQRSADVFLGVPFNIASYALLTQIIAHHLGYEVGDFIWTGGDCHLYLNHMEQVHEMLSREAPPKLPRVKLNYPANTPFEQIQPEHFQLIGYQPLPAIKAPVAV